MNRYARKHFVLCLALAGSAYGVFAAPTGGTQVQRTTIVVKGSGPYFQLDIPITIYPGSLHPDLQDVRVRNAAGDLLAFAWTDVETVSSQVESRSVGLFSLRENQSTAVSSFRQNPDGSLTPLASLQINKKNPVATWILDLSQVKGSLLQARFNIDAQADGMFGFRLESSDDLKNWNTLSSDEQLVQLHHHNDQIQSLELNLHQVNARYLRLHWNDPAYAPWIESVSVDSQQRSYTAPLLQWSKPIQANTCTAKYCDYMLPVNTPIDSLRIAISEPNTLAKVTVLGLLDAVKPASSYHHRYSPLYPLHVLRDQKRAVEAQSDREVWLNEMSIYRIQQANGEAKSPDLLMDGASYKALRLQTNGPMTTLGQTPPAIQIASLPRRLVFLGRGAPPYTLEWGVAASEGAASDIRTLMPYLDGSKPVQADVATVEIAETVAAPLVKNLPPFPVKEYKPWLWVVLVAGLALLGAMVWSLLKSMSTQADKKQG